MNKPKTRLIILIFCLLATLASTVSAQTPWRLDADKNKAEPRNFRLMTDTWHREFQGEAPTRRGLDRLMASASGQPSLIGLKWIQNKITAVAPPETQIYIVDLRQESHGYVNQIPVSLYAEHNQVNRGKDTSTVEKDEQNWLMSLKTQKIRFVPMGKSDTKLFIPLTITIDTTQTESQLVSEANMHYARFAVADSEWAAAQTIDDFLQFVAGLPDNAWLHFHCHAGQGRTTSFAVMYDKLRNPDIPIETLAKRQYLLGGANLLAKVTGRKWSARTHRHRAKMLRLFGKYVEDVTASQNKITWSQWLLKQNTEA